MLPEAANIVEGICARSWALSNYKEARGMVPKGRDLLRWALVVAVSGVILAGGGTFVSIHFIEGTRPTKLSLANSISSSLATSISSGGGRKVVESGVWNAGSGSIVGYRVREVLLVDPLPTGESRGFP